MLLSCDNPKPRHIVFPKTFTVKGEGIQGLAATTGNIIVTEKFLLEQQFSGDFFLRVYDRRNLSEFLPLAKKGTGENEFPTMMMFDQFEKCGGDECIWVHDLNKGELVRINLTKSMVVQTTVVDMRISTRAESRFYTAFYVDSLHIIGRSTNSTPQMNRLQIYNPKSGVIEKTVHLFPEVKGRSNDLEFILNKFNMIYISSIGMKGDKTRVASMMCSFDRLDIFEMDGTLENTTFDGFEIPESTDKYLKATDADALNMYYAGICTSNDYIYGLYLGQPFSEFGVKPVPSNIRMFDWIGRPVCVIKVDEYLTSLTIDEANGLMYGVDTFHKNVIRYNIKHVLNEL